jgi:hypothetical protein
VTTLSAGGVWLTSSCNEDGPGVSREDVAEQACDRIIECTPAGEVDPQRCADDYLAGLEDDTDACVEAIQSINRCLAALPCDGDGEAGCAEEIDRARVMGCDLTI